MRSPSSPYANFLSQKSQDDTYSGFDPVWIPSFLFDFQQVLVEWAVKKGKAAIFADCGLGKTPMQLVWAENVVRHTNKRVLILTPLAVSHQTVTEANKFGIECHRSRAGELREGINVTNYEQLHHFNSTDFAGVVCDESSILKSFDGVTRGAVTEFMRMMPYRLLCTATAAPNDYIELGCSSEALGQLGYTDMLTRFFKNDQHTIKPMTYRRKGQNVRQLDDRAKWRLKGHAELPFWRWVSSWARALRRPSDLGFDDARFVLPQLVEREHLIKPASLSDGMFFALLGIGLAEQRQERKRTIKERCEWVATLVSSTGRPALVWCHLNDEGNLLANLIGDSAQIRGGDSDDAKEERFQAFVQGQLRVLVTKPKIGAWGLNFQHCAHVVCFPSYSYEQYYQGVRRCWRFGQTRRVVVDVVTTESEQGVRAGLQRKAAAADAMFSSLVAEMTRAVSVVRTQDFLLRETVPTWL